MDVYGKLGPDIHPEPDTGVIQKRNYENIQSNMGNEGPKRMRQHLSQIYESVYRAIVIVELNMELINNL